jgi:tRNA threonylcarbamoyladenosine biosynthesis protein TsaE
MSDWMNLSAESLSRSLPLTVQTGSPAETEQLGAVLAEAFASGSTLPPYIALYGDLGVGKTAFVRGFASVYAPGRTVRSPTFALVNEYRISGKLPLFHFDMYRITSEDDLYSIGYDDYLDRGICLVEWCEHIPFALPPRRLAVTIQKTTSAFPDERLIRLEIQED